jgi:hypothetical protein
VQIAGKERIYMVGSGRLEVFTNSNQNYRIQFKRLLKSIAPTSPKEVTDNIYGYTSMMTERPVRLSAISKDFTSVYYLDKE